MIKLLLLISLSFCYESDYFDNLQIFYTNKSLNIDFLKKINSEASFVHPKLKSGLMSAIIPGSSQYFLNEQKSKGMLFFGIEILTVLSSMIYKNNAEDFKFLYQDYGDIHWSFSNWCDHYYDYNDQENPNIDMFSYYNEELDLYEYSPINSGHGLEFFVDHETIEGSRIYFKTNTTGFGELYHNENLDQDGVAEQFVQDRNLQMLKTHDFYEEIVKYDQFFSGWDDQELIQRITNGWGADNATSPNKSYYKLLYNKSIKNYNIHNSLVTAIYINHVISMLDALIFSINSSSVTSLKYDYNPNLNFHQAQISIKL
tara:strand:+ start:154 stop:1095 length:942 start_codon:yes stop_codon:yes gene_type:complete